MVARNGTGRDVNQSRPKRDRRRQKKAQARLTARDRRTVASVAEALGQYFKSSGRSFPWREDKDPYRTAVAEVMLTKTRAESIVGILADLLRRYPNPTELAKADPEELEKKLRPLGLSRKRTLYLQRMGRALADSGTEVLRQRQTALSIPGLGIYAAAAVACFVFGEPVGIVDANVRRVLSRVFKLRPTSKARLAALADAVALAADDPRATNYGLLDLGALVCKGRPRCQVCPLALVCSFGAQSAARQQPTVYTLGSIYRKA